MSEYLGMFILNPTAAFWIRYSLEICKLGRPYIKLTIAESRSNKGMLGQLYTDYPQIDIS